MKYNIALAGNPNSGKTTLFNGLTGSSQYVGNWPGVTVEKKEGKLKGNAEVTILDLPGIYSLSPYTPEEVISREYLVNERPDAIINIIDGTNIERNLYLTLQLLELGIPMVIAVNMIDIVRKRGDTIDIVRLSDALGCEVLELSALRNEGSAEVAAKAVALAMHPAERQAPLPFSDETEQTIAVIEQSLTGIVPEHLSRWFAIKVFERDRKVTDPLLLDSDRKRRIEQITTECENALDDDAESIVTSERYEAIRHIMDAAVVKKAKKHSLSPSDRIDRIVTNRLLALPIFALIMFGIYFIAMGPLGTFITDWTNEELFGSIISENLLAWMEHMEFAPWLIGLVVDGIIAGVGAVLGFVPQMLLLFLMLSVLEDIGYMARVAFIMDRIFRKMGLSGKSFIPMLIASGCAVPAIMASRTIESEHDRRMTVTTTAFIPCSAKLPIIGLFAGAIFGGSSLVAVSAYFIGIGSIILSGIILKKTKLFAGEASPFVMELPAYHMPNVGGVLRATWERGWSFIVRAGTVILISAIIIWFLQSFGFTDSGLEMVEDNNGSILAALGSVIAPLFLPLGFGNWQATVATITGLVAKENVVSTFGVLFQYSGELSEAGEEIWGTIPTVFTPLSAYGFLIFNLLCAPCFGAIGAIRREMNSTKWTLFAVGYMTGFAYVISLIVYQIGLFLSTGQIGFGTVAALALITILVYLLFRKNPHTEEALSGRPIPASSH